MDFEVTLYTRQKCKLCDQAKEDLIALQKEFPHTLTEVFIDQDPDLVALYGHKVPVISAGPFTLTAPFDRRKLRMTLGAARDSHFNRNEDQGDSYQKKLSRNETMSTGDKISYFMSAHYLKVVNLILILYVGLPFLAPVLM
ncbi:MAG: glutaredoxin family protein, partial [Anaerolineales bacterium]